MMPCSLVSMFHFLQRALTPYLTKIRPTCYLVILRQRTDRNGLHIKYSLSLSLSFSSVKLTKSRWNQNVKWKWSGMFLWILPISMPPPPLPHIGSENREVRPEIRWKQILLHSAALSIFIPTCPFQHSSSSCYSAKCNNDTSIWYSVSRLKRWSIWRVLQRCLISFFSQAV